MNNYIIYKLYTKSSQRRGSHIISNIVHNFHAVRPLFAGCITVIATTTMASPEISPVPKHHTHPTRQFRQTSNVLINFKGWSSKIDSFYMNRWSVHSISKNKIQIRNASIVRWLTQPQVGALVSLEDCSCTREYTSKGFLLLIISPLATA